MWDGRSFFLLLSSRDWQARIPLPCTCSAVPDHPSPQWLVKGNKYLGRHALQVGLRDVEIGESGPLAGRCT